MQRVEVVEGKPQPLPEAEEERLRQELKQLDPLLDLRWFPTLRYGSQGYEGRYGLCCQWPQQDRRWEMYHAGEIGEPFDLLGVYEEAADGSGLQWHGGHGLPLDPSQLLDRTMELLAACDNTKHSWRDRLRYNAEKNRQLVAKRKADVLDESLEGAKHYRRMIQKGAFSTGASFDDTQQGGET